MLVGPFEDIAPGVSGVGSGAAKGIGPRHGLEREIEREIEGGGEEHGRRRRIREQTGSSKIKEGA